MIPAQNRRQDGSSEKNSDHLRIRFPPWLITYSDLITLLLTLFILLMSMADLDPVRFNKASNSLKGAFGIRPEPAGTEVIVPVFPAPPIVELDPVQKTIINRIYQNIKTQIDDFDLNDTIQISKPGSDILLVRINNSLLFEPGEEQLLPSSFAFLDKVARSVKDHPLNIRIEGHTDAAETAGQFANSWELSTARAVSVLRYFVQDRRLNIDRLSAAGYGSARPASAERGDSNEALNRRVDIVLKADFSSGTTSASNHRSDVPL